MKFTTKLLFNKFLKIVSYITPLCFLCLFLSCQIEKSSKEGHKIYIDQDSILGMIETGRDIGKSVLNRKAILDEALQLIEEGESDTLKLRYLYNIQLGYLDIDDSLSFRTTNSSTHILANQLGDSIRIGFSHWDLAYFFEKKSKKDSAYFYYGKALGVFKATGDSYRTGEILYALANLQSKIKDYTGSEINVVKAIEVLKPLEAYDELFYCYNLLGVISKDLKEYDRSLEHYAMANKYLIELDNKNSKQTSLNNNIGVVYKEKGEYKKAIIFFNKVLEIDSLTSKKPLLFARTLTNLAESQYKLNPNADVKPLFEKALKIRDSIGDFAGMAASHYFLAEYDLGKNDTIHALSNALLAKKYAKQSENNERLLEALGMLIHIDRKNASTHTHQYIRLNDSLHMAERQIRDKFTRIQFETDEVAAENVILAKEKQFWAGIAVALLLLGLSIYMIADQRIKNQKLRFQEQQQTNNQEIFNLMLSQSQKLEEGKKMEQKRISEELHDGVLGKMLGARMLLTGLNKKSDAAAITQRSTAIEALKNVEGEVRSISHELSHAAYQKIHNFISSIQNLMDGIGQNAQIDCNFTYSNNLDWDGLSGDIKINVYRIIQECLQNTVKHAVCKNVRVDFEAKGENLKIQITDDGKGFEFKKVKKGIGIRNIKSRVLKLNGTWRANSTIGNGSTIIINVPIKYYTNAMELKENGVTLNKA